MLTPRQSLRHARAERFGMLTDRYGTAWAVNGGPREMPKDGT